MKKLAIAFAATAATLLSTGAMAQVYVSGGIGAGHQGVDCSGVPACDNNDMAVKLTGGYTIGSGFAAELGYITFGQTTATAPGVGVHTRADAFTLGVAYQFALSENWSLNARLGAASMKSSVSVGVTGLGSASQSDTKTVAYYGLGAGLAVSKETRLEFSGDFSRAEFAGEKANVRAITFGLRHDF